MRRHLKQEHFLRRLLSTAFVLGIITVSFLAAKSFAQTIQNGDKVEENTELTYYLTVTSDGVDGAGISSENGQIANVYNGTVTATDKLPERLEFVGFETTENGHFAAVSQSDHTTTCGGIVVDDTQEEGAAEGHWNDDETDFYYHGLHYNPSNRTVSYRVQHLQAGCELTIGIKVRTPILLSGSVRYDFFNTAILNDHGLIKNSNTVHFWMGRSLADNHNEVSYEYTGDIPENAPAVPETMIYAVDQCIMLAPEPFLEGYTFSGWSRKDNGRTYPNSFCLNGTFTFVGSFTPNEQPEKNPVIYQISGEKPSDYTEPTTKNYEAGQTVNIDSLSDGAKVQAYTFSGWSSDDVNIDSGTFTMPNEQVTLRGSFTHQTYTLSYTFIGDAPNNASSLLPATRAYEAGARVNLADAPSADGWEFLGWNSPNPFEMPEKDLTITGQWRKLTDNFEPRITKTIINPQDKYHKGDTVLMEVTVENTANYPIYEIILKDDNDGTSFVAQEGATLINSQTIEISQIEAGQSVTLRLEYLVTRNENITITDITELVSATADEGHQLDTTKQYQATSVFDLEAQGDPDVTPPPSGDNPNTYDNSLKTSDKVIMVASLLVLIVSIILLANKNSRNAKTLRALALVLALPAIAGLTYSISAARSYAKQQAQTSVMSRFYNFNSQEGNSWRLSKTIRWENADTARISFTFDSYAPERTKPIDLIISIPNDVYTSHEQFAEYKAYAMDTVDRLLENSQNRIGVVSMDKYSNFDRTPSVTLAPTNNRAAIEAALNQIVEHDYDYGDFSSLPLEAAKLILTADNDGIERDPIVVGFGKYLDHYTNSAGSYEAAKSLVPNISYRAGFEYEYDYKGLADRIRAEKTFDTSVINHFDITLSDIIDTDNFDVVNTPIIYFEERNRRYSIRDYGYDYALTQEGSNLGISINNFPVGDDFHFDILVKLKNPNSTEHQVYTPNQSLSFDITTRDFDKELAKEHYNLNGNPSIMNGFKLSYDPNTPSGCEISTPASTIHNAATLVHVETEPLSCPGYKFAGYSTGGQELNTQGSEYLIMPEEDVTYRATWIKSDIKKSMDGTLSSGTAAYMYYNFRSKAYGLSNYQTIKAIKTADALPENFDTSDNKNIISEPNSEIPIYAWYEDETIYIYTDADQIYLAGNMNNMLYGLSSIEDISGLADWDVSKVTSFFGFFDSMNSLSDLTPIADWDVSNADDFQRMFYYNNSLTDLTPLANWDISNAENLAHMFEYDEGLESLDGLQGWNTSKVTNAVDMFANTNIRGVSELSGWNTSSLQYSAEMFANTKLESLDGLESWNVSNLENAQLMFSGGYERNLITDISDLASWRPCKLTSLRRLFYGQSNLEDASALAGWAECSENFVSLEGMLTSTKIASLEPFSEWDVSNVQNFSNAFASTQISSLEPISDWRIGAATSLGGAFNGTQITNLSGIEHLIDNASSFNIAISAPFLQNIDALDAWKTQTNKITGISFASNPSLTDISGLENWTNTTNLTSLYGAFKECTSLQDISPLSALNTSNVTTIEGIFNKDTQITDLQAISGWSTANLTNMSSAFYNMTGITDLSPLSGWNTGSVTNMSLTFSGMQNITNLDALSGWDVANVKNMSSAFSSMTNLTSVQGLSTWTTTSLTNLNTAFQNDANVITFTPLNSWYTAKATKTNTFRGVPSTTPKPSWY